MTNIHIKRQAQMMLGLKVRVEMDRQTDRQTDGRTDGRTEAIALRCVLMRSVRNVTARRRRVHSVIIYLHPVVPVVSHPAVPTNGR